MIILYLNNFNESKSAISKLFERDFFFFKIKYTYKQLPFFTIDGKRYDFFENCALFNKAVSQIRPTVYTKDLKFANKLRERFGFFVDFHSYKKYDHTCVTVGKDIKATSEDEIVSFIDGYKKQILKQTTPTWSEAIKHYAIWLIFIALNKTPRSSLTPEQKAAKCRKCPFLDGLRCSRCKCRVGIKTQKPKTHCPIDKW